MHMKGTFHNAELSRVFGVKLVILVRRINDIVVSLAHDLRLKEDLPGFGSGLNGYSFIWQNENVKALDDPRLFDLIIDLIVPWYVNFIVSWDCLTRKADSEVLWLTYEAMMADKADALDRVLKFAELTPRTEELETAIHTEYSTFNNSAVGRGDELLTNEQKARIQICARTIRIPTFGGTASEEE